MNFNQASYDRAQATYRWLFHLCQSVTDASVLVGYSKKEGKRENADKQQLLISTLSRLLGPTHRYLEKAWHMEIFRRRPGSVGLMEEKMADLYQQRYVLHGEAQFDLGLIAFLEVFYRAVHAGTLDQLPPLARPTSNQQEKNDFAFRPDAYATRAVLVDHCKTLLHRYERERVTAYWFSYCQIHHPDWLALDQPAASAGSNRPPAAEAQEPAPVAEPGQEATREALAKLRAKYTKGRP